MMSEYKCHKIRRDRIPNDERCLFKATDKPIFMIVILWGIYLYILSVIENKLLSLPILIYCGFMTFRQEEIPFAGYETFFVVYNRDDQSDCDIYYTNEIKQWKYNAETLKHKIEMELVDGEQITIDTEVDYDMYLYFRKMMKEKETK